jgi:ectoine hydroxylase-related dioxygenase (phytanoyl-CoA dioxygenase family)
MTFFCIVLKIIMSKEKKPYEISNVTTSNLNLKNFKEYNRIYKKYGVLVFRSFFEKDNIFNEYYKDLSELVKKIIIKNKLKINAKQNLNKLISEVSTTNRKDIGHLYDLGTRPVKLLSGIKLKSHPKIVNIVKYLMEKKSILAHPFLGETLHIFPPGKKNFEYNLPMHQDYPYIMQSPEQITAYVNLGKLQPQGNGGIKILLGSHREGVMPNTNLKNGKRVTKNIKYFINKYKSQNFYFDKGDFAIFNSLLHHEGIQNHSNCTRIVQLIRYSNLLDKKSISYLWQSSEGKKRDGIKFEDVH